ncbi:hypothetical protein FLL45_01385 [Aliikangiella marina]|uniref:Uncharacterized protein n=1 Tax=Aliikangiella marina TaxID=1712262 RepID=A0A545THD3_9GAMM|nr:hypothetical protein [Aliikangiella marina]TQV76639.1 hypothetical protein FLL45_01385 [Aliikangiella marina]
MLLGKKYEAFSRNDFWYEEEITPTWHVRRVTYLFWIPIWKTTVFNSLRKEEAKIHAIKMNKTL